MADRLITVVGSGTGGGPPAGAEALPSGTALVAGAARHLAGLDIPSGVRQLALGPVAPALDAIEECVRGGRRVTVLASGDPGFFGIVRALAARFGSAALDVRPSAPAVAVAFARLGLTWDDAVVVSAHGRDLRTAVNVCRARRRVAVLTGPGAGPAELGAALAGTGIERTLVVASGLGTDAESVVHVTPEEAAGRDWSGAVSVVLCLGPRPWVAHAPRTIAGPPPGPAQWALAEGEFAHRDAMLTKAEVRALVLARLGPRTGDLVWDIGAGSGSVAVECARFGAAVVAVERDPDGVARVRRNAAAHGVDVEAVHASAPAVLGRLPDPDAVFVGGGGADLPRIVAECARRARRRIVVTLAALDRVAAVRTALESAGLVPDGVLLQSSRLTPLPGPATRLSPQNPVFVLWADVPRAGGEDPTAQAATGRGAAPGGPDVRTSRSGSGPAAGDGATATPDPGGTARPADRRGRPRRPDGDHAADDAGRPRSPAHDDPDASGPPPGSTHAAAKDPAQDPEPTAYPHEDGHPAGETAPAGNPAHDTPHGMDSSRDEVDR